MARQPRKRSQTGIYHIMLRGLDKRDIFLDDEDKEKFLAALFKAKETGGFKIYGYCLMDNHVHLLLRECEEIGTSIKRITVSYVQWHNNKYGRTGHLFQNRFKSETVETEIYLMVVLRYIHQNPVKANIVENAKDYRWSSYNDYMDVYHKKPSHIDSELFTNYFKTMSSFEAYMNEPNDDKCLEYKEINRCGDRELLNKIKSLYNIENLSGLKKEERAEIIIDIYQTMDVSIRQLSRVLGLGKSVVERTLKKDR